MRTTFALVKPGEMEATISITMPLKEWSQLRDQLPGQWPAHELSRQIGDVVAQAEKRFYAETPEGAKA